MSENRIVYRKPPVIEAICQLKLARHSKWTPATAGQLWEELEPDYPLDIEEQQGVQASLTLTQSGLQSSLEPQTKRVIFHNKDRNKAAVLGPDVVSTNGLPGIKGGTICLSGEVGLRRVWSGRRSCGTPLL